MYINGVTAVPAKADANTEARCGGSRFVCSRAETKTTSCRLRKQASDRWDLRVTFDRGRMEGRISCSCLSGVRTTVRTTHAAVGIVQHFLGSTLEQLNTSYPTADFDETVTLRTLETSITGIQSKYLSTYNAHLGQIICMIYSHFVV